MIEALRSRRLGVKGHEGNNISGSKDWRSSNRQKVLEGPVSQIRDTTCPAPQETFYWAVEFVNRPRPRLSLREADTASWLISQRPSSAQLLLKLTVRRSEGAV